MLLNVLLYHQSPSTAPFFSLQNKPLCPFLTLNQCFVPHLNKLLSPFGFRLGQLAYYNFLNNMYSKIISVTSFFHVPAQLTTTFWLYYSPVPPDIKTYSNHIQLYSANCIRIKVRINNLFCTTVEFSVMDNVLESPYSLDASAKSQENTHFRLEYVSGVYFVLCLMWKGTLVFTFFFFGFNFFSGGSMCRRRTIHT